MISLFGSKLTRNIFFWCHFRCALCFDINYRLDAFFVLFFFVLCHLQNASRTESLFYSLFIVSRQETHGKFVGRQALAVKLDHIPHAHWFD